jgi:hypothetical protein
LSRSNTRYGIGAIRVKDLTVTSQKGEAIRPELNQAINLKKREGEKGETEARLSFATTDLLQNPKRYTSEKMAYNKNSCKPLNYLMIIFEFIRLQEFAYPLTAAFQLPKNRPVFHRSGKC